MSGRRFLALLLCSLPGLGSCTDIIGIEELPKAEVEAGAGPSCDDCENAHCGDELAECTADSDCDQAYACLARCPTLGVACRAACERLPGAGEESFRALDACRRLECVDQCYGVGGLVSPSESSLCSECVDRECRPETATCIQTSPFGAPLSPGSCERDYWCMTREPVSPAQTFACLGGYVYPASSDNQFLYMRVDQCWPYCDFGKRWSCLDAYSWPEAGTDDFVYHAYIRDGTKGYMTTSTLPRMYVSACAADDCERCEHPIASGLADAIDDSDGLPADLTLPAAGFDGCFSIVEDEVAATIHYFPTLHYPARPITRDEGRATIGVQRALDATLQAQLGISLDPERGHLLIAVYDCLGDPAMDVFFVVEPTNADVVPFYMQGTIFPEFTPGPTMWTGVGGFFNVVPGRHEVRGELSDGSVVSSADVVVRPGWVTQVTLYPRPRQTSARRIER